MSIWKNLTKEGCSIIAAKKQFTTGDFRPPWKSLFPGENDFFSLSILGRNQAILGNFGDKLMTRGEVCLF